MRNNLRKTINDLNPGDSICCSWCDASVGKGSSTGTEIDVPVRSWGIYVGLIGEKIKHIVVAHDIFRYSDGLFDLDYTAIPLSCATDIAVMVKNQISLKEGRILVNSFLHGGHRTVNRLRTFQRRLLVHERSN